MEDYFVEDLKYNKDIFRHRFRMSKRLFLKIVADVEANDSWFQEALDARGRKGFTPLQKVTSAIKQLATERTSRECLEYFCDTSIEANICEEITDTRLLCSKRLHLKTYGFGMLLPVHRVLKTISMYYNNLPERNGTAPKCPFYVNNHLYKRGYLLADGIYPSWSVRVKSIPYPHEVDQKKFKRQHEATRKDVERAFGVLKAKWGVLSRPMGARSVNKIRSVVYTCINLHNMILKDDGRAIAPVHIRDSPVEPALDDTVLGELMDEDTHWRLKQDLINYLTNQHLPHLLVDSDED
ncbi:uncharacterized protein LOC110876112 [Helianthus annuus]|uniref:uncharacterized protein LOC110876112 n=1 Tax=Helianthus annuus TaxID=4232 RepID=UPI000B90A2AB|nr:uncharacterized protein LOC110876112 [Helianthus annuus]